MAPLVSILIPAFNAEEWIADTLRSAIAQTWPRKEIIVVDDGSTDQTVKVARQFEPEGVRVTRQENLGAAAARNRALSLSQGDYIQWLDADDLLAPDKVARQVSVLDRGSKRTLVSSAFAKFVHRYYRAVFTPTALWCDLSPVEWLCRKLAQNLYMQTATWLVSRQLTESAGPWDPRMLIDDDGEYFSRVLLATDCVRFVSDAKVFYRLSGPKKLSHIGTSGRKRGAQWLSIKLHIERIRSLEDSARIRAACLVYLQRWLAFFYPERPDIVREAEQLAEALGGQLETPRLRWKYRWVEALFGRRLANRAQSWLPGVRWQLSSTWEKALFHLEAVRFAHTLGAPDWNSAREYQRRAELANIGPSK